MRIPLSKKNLGASVLALSLLASLSTRAEAATPVQPTFFDRYDYAGNCAPPTGGIAAGDINGDGIPDLVCSFYNGVGTLFGNGDGTFRPGPTSNVGPLPPIALVLVDLNGDGTLDLISFGTPNGFKPSRFYGVKDANSGRDRFFSRQAVDEPTRCK